MNCSICSKPIVLVPSAVERTKKYGGKPSDYTKLFTTHSQCQVEKRNKESRELMKRISKEREAKRVTYPLNDFKR